MLAKEQYCNLHKNKIKWTIKYRLIYELKCMLTKKEESLVSNGGEIQEDIFIKLFFASLIDVYSFSFSWY